MTVETGDGDVAEIAISHPIARSERSEIVPFHIGDNSTIASSEICLERARHPDRMKTLPSMTGCREAFVHVYILVIEMESQAGKVEIVHLSGIPAVSRKRGAREKSVAFVALA